MEIYRIGENEKKKKKGNLSNNIFICTYDSL